MERQEPTPSGRPASARGVVPERAPAPPARPPRPGRDATPRVRPPAPDEVRRLVRELETVVAGEVRFDAGSRAVYATDLSMYRQVPIGVIVPRDAADVERAVAVCRAHGVPVLGRGCGTSLAGQCCNVAVVFDFSKYMNRLRWLDPGRRLARVEPGLINDQLREAAERHRLTFGPDPATHAYCTLGGQIGNNSCGVHSVMAGRTVDNVESLEVLTYDGLRMEVGATDDAEYERILARGGRRAELFRALRALRDRHGEAIRAGFPRIPRRVSGYSVDELLPERGFHVARALVGHEGTCALVLAATVRLVPSPQGRVTALFAYPDVLAAAEDVPLMLEQAPIGVEAIERHVIENMRRKGQEPDGARHLPDGRCWLLVEFGGADRDEATARADAAVARVGARTRSSGHRVLADLAEQRAVWLIRESGVAASRVPGVEDAWPSWEDAAVAPERLAGYLRDFAKLVDEFGYRYTLFGHFGDGCVHTRITFDVKTEDGLRRYRQFMERAADLVVRHGGSLSGEHGDGQARGELLPRMYGPDVMEAFRAFKRAWDPTGRMNPGKKIDPYPLDTNIRYGPARRLRPVRTWFSFAADGGLFANATERCFGVGKCRALGGATMCPSFQVTREEKHSTRGRAHLLYEMLAGEEISRGWRDDAVKEALDLCLACKGCKNDCPVNVDMATYKAEFLAHYYEGRLRPRHAYALGLVSRWARAAELAPGVANALARLPGASGALKALAGIAPERPLPPFAEETFRRGFGRRRSRVRDGAPRVMLWPDTFNDHFLPATAHHAVEVLEGAGYAVELPARRVCCGRPLYDYGMLARARDQLLEDLEVLEPALEAGTPIVFLEPSCAAVFRDELPNLLPDDPAARRLSRQTVLLADQLERTDGWSPPRLERQAILHGHCHQKAVLGGTAAEERILARMGARVTKPDSGCCGMAGSFGYEREHYGLSMKIGERVLLPEVRRAPLDALLVADGFSCREQIAQGTARQALHLADVLALAFQEEGSAERPLYPESRYVEPPAPARVGVLALVGVAACALGLAVVGRAVARRG